MADTTRTFVRESTAAIDSLNEGLVDLEMGIGGDVDELFRIAHTLKGNAAAEGHRGPAELAHALEELLSAIRAGEVDPDPDAMDVAFEAVDALETAVGEVDRHGEVRSEHADVAAELRGIVPGDPDPPTVDGDPTSADGPGRAGGEAEDAHGRAGAESDPDPGRTDSDPPGIDDIAPPDADEEDVSVEEALERASAFDDLEGLAERVDDAEEFAGLEGAGTFDNLSEEAGSGDATGDGETGDGSASDPAAGDLAQDGPDTDGDPDDAAAEFSELREAVDQPDTETLQAELDEVSFGEFDDEDDMAIDDLVGLDPATGHARGTEDSGDPSPDAGLGTDPTADEGSTAGGSRADPTPDDASPEGVASPGASGDPPESSEGPPDPDGTGEEAPDPDESGEESDVDVEELLSAAIDDGGDGTEGSGDTDEDSTASESVVDAIRSLPGEDDWITPEEAGDGADDPELDRALADDTATSGAGDPGEPGADGPGDPTSGSATTGDRPATERTDPGPATTTDGCDGEPRSEREPRPAPEPRSEPGGTVDDRAVGGEDWETLDPADDPEAVSTGPTGDSAPDRTIRARDTEREGTGMEMVSDPEDDGSELGRERPGIDREGSDLELDLGSGGESRGSVGDGRPGIGSLDAANDGTDDEPGFRRDEATAEFAESFRGEFEVGEGESEGPARVSATIEAALGGEDGTGTATPAGTGGGTVPVEAGDADRLLGLAERLITTRTRLDREYDGDDEGVREALSELRGIAADLEETVTSVRLVPVEEAFRGLSRAVRDAARGAEAEVRLETGGGDVELDRAIVDALGDPLGHLVRNAVAHGIEPPAEREAAGKPREGTVTIRAERDGDRAVVEVADDGAGIDPDEIRETAIERGVIDEVEAAVLDPEDVTDLLFRPGFSTRASVDEVSGRGVGLDAVATTVREFDGDVSMESTPGEGTTVRLELPVSVAAEEVLFVTVGEEEYAVPAGDVARVEDADLARVEDGDLLVASHAGDAATEGDGSPDGVGAEDPAPAAETTGPPREDPGATPAGAGAAVAVDGAETTVERYPVVDLAEAFDVPRGSRGPGVYVRIRDAVEPVALRVDEVGEWRTAVVTPYDEYFDDVPGIGGATSVGGGRVVNTVDVGSLEVD